DRGMAWPEGHLDQRGRVRDDPVQLLRSELPVQRVALLRVNLWTVCRRHGSGTTHRCHRWMSLGGGGPVDSRATRPVSRETVPRVPPSVTDCRSRSIAVRPAAEVGMSTVVREGSLCRPASVLSTPMTLMSRG